MARTRTRLWLIPAAGGIGLAIATSGTRAALVTVVVSMLAFGVIAAASRDSARVVAGLAIVALLIYAAFSYLGPSNSTARRAQSISPGKIVSTFSSERGSSVSKFGDYASSYPLGLGVGSVGPAAVALGNHPGDQTLNTETEWNFLVIEVGIAGLALYVLLNLRLMGLALTRIRRIADPAMRLRLAALASPLFGLAVAGFAGVTTASVPPAPYFWFVAGVLSYWLLGAGRDEPRLSAGGAGAEAGTGRAGGAVAGERGGPPAVGPRRPAPVGHEPVLRSSPSRPG